MRLKLIVVLAAIVAVFMFMCSCTANVQTQSYSNDFDVRRVYHGGYDITIYQVTTPKGSVYVARYGQGLCTLN